MRISDSEARQALMKLDPGVGERMGFEGKSGALLYRGSNGTVWKLTADSYETPVAKALVGVATKTLVPVLRAVPLDRIQDGLCAVQTKEMLQLSSAERQSLFNAIDDGELSGFSPDADPDAVAWINLVGQESSRFGIEQPDLINGENNVMKDSSGHWRLVDLG